jgi:hypothetical protein
MTQARYLTMFDLFRVVVCAFVLGQHSLLWADMSNTVVGTAFVTVLHFIRNALFLFGLVVCYTQITRRPRTVSKFWTGRYLRMGVPYLAWTAIYVLFVLSINLVRDALYSNVVGGANLAWPIRSLIGTPRVCVGELT